VGSDSDSDDNYIPEDKTSSSLRKDDAEKGRRSGSGSEFTGKFKAAPQETSVITGKEGSLPYKVARDRVTTTEGTEMRKQMDGVATLRGNFGLFAVLLHWTDTFAF
jgi:hypothetical protein